jgi:hypothetical protein
MLNKKSFPLSLRPAVFPQDPENQSRDVLRPLIVAYFSYLHVGIFDSSIN